MRKGDDARQEGHIVSLTQPPPWSQEISGAMEEKRRGTIVPCRHPSCRPCLAGRRVPFLLVSFPRAGQQIRLASPRGGGGQQGQGTNHDVFMRCVESRKVVVAWKEAGAEGGGSSLSILPLNDTRSFPALAARPRPFAYPTYSSTPSDTAHPSSLRSP
jgi:hypothetical protein